MVADRLMIPNYGQTPAAPKPPAVPGNPLNAQIAQALPQASQTPQAAPGLDWQKQGLTDQYYRNIGNADRPNSAVSQYTAWNGLSDTMAAGGIWGKPASDLSGYQVGYGKNADGTGRQAIFDPNGSIIAGKSGYDAHTSLQHGDYAKVAGTLAGTFLGPAAYEAAGGGIAGGAAAGASVGGVTGGLQDQSLQGAAKGAIAGGLAGAAGGALSGNTSLTGPNTNDFYGSPSDMGTAADASSLAGDAYSSGQQSALTSPLTSENLNQNLAENLPSQTSPTQVPNPTSTGTQYSTPESFAPSTPIAPPMASSGGASPGVDSSAVAPSPQYTPTTPAAAPDTGALSGLTDFAKANPLLTASLAATTLGKLNNPGSPPTMSSSSTGSTATTQALTSALEQKLYGPNAAQPDFSQIPALKTTAGDPTSYYKTAADAMYNRQTEYLDPQVKQQQQALEARLAEQGFVPGTPGYNQAMQTFQDTNARAYAAARDSAINEGVTAGQNLFQNNMGNAQLNNNASNATLSQILQERSQPFNEYATLRTGNQIDAKQQYAADLGNYNAQVSSSNSTNQALGQLATALAIYYSDARLKDDISPIGQTPGGANLYEYTVFGRRERGVIAQELLKIQPDAVLLDPKSGYYMVDYRKVK